MRPTVEIDGLAWSSPPLASLTALRQDTGMDPVTHPIPIDHLPASMTVDDLRARVTDLLDWHLQYGRHDLPWVGQSDPYIILTSEIMLQQTQVGTILARWAAWMRRFPDAARLAAANPQDVVAAWEGLGYPARARRLREAAAILVRRGMPTSREERLSLPGVGPTTASALGAFVHDAREAIFDGNVRRIWARLTGWPDTTPADQRALWSLAQHATGFVPEGRMGAWSQAQMDLGATVCTPRTPRCAACPWQRVCAWHRAPVAAVPARVARATQRTVAVWVWDTNSVGARLVERHQGTWWQGLWVPPDLPEPAWPEPVRTAAAHWQQGGAWAPDGTLGYGVAHLTGRAIAWCLVAGRSEHGQRVSWNQMDQHGLPIALRRWLGLVNDGDRG